MASALFALICRSLMRRSEDRFHLLLGWWVLITSVAELAGGVLSLLGMNNALLYDVEWLSEFVMLMVIFRTLSPKAARFVPAVVAFFLALWVVNLWWSWRSQEFVIYSFIIGAFVLGASYLYLLWHVANTWTARLRQAPQFWLCLAVLLYFGGAAPLVGSINYFIHTDMALARNLYRGVDLLCVLKFCLMGVTCLRTGITNTAVSHEPAV